MEPNNKKQLLDQHGNPLTTQPQKLSLKDCFSDPNSRLKLLRVAVALAIWIGIGVYAWHYSEQNRNWKVFAFLSGGSLFSVIKIIRDDRKYID